jgi:Skp family chaperone for outer membrane proteins
MPRRGPWLALVAVLALALPGWSQDLAPGPDTHGAIVLLDQDRLFAESAFGRASLQRERAAAEALDAENTRIEADLVAEEQDLTARRPTLPAEEFTALATAFDEKVERIRAEQEEKIRALGQERDADRAAFRRAVVPVLGEVLEETGASVILDKNSVILALRALDVTDLAIARVDAALAGEDPAPGPGADPQAPTPPLPDPAPGLPTDPAPAP